MPSAFSRACIVPIRVLVFYLPVLVFILKVNQRELDGDWFQSIRDKLNWNLRTLQSPYHDDQVSDLVGNDPSRCPPPSGSPFQPRFFTLPTSPATENVNDTNSTGSPTRDSPI